MGTHAAIDSIDGDTAAKIVRMARDKGKGVCTMTLCSQMSVYLWHGVAEQSMLKLTVV